MNTAESINNLKEASGLTWDQLSKLFGMSRNALINWSVGGLMTTHSKDTLNELLTLVKELPADSPTRRRELLFASDNEGYSIYDRIRMRCYEENSPLHE